MFTYGTIVKVIFGFYLGCTGQVLNYRTVSTGANGLKHYEYYVTLTKCPKKKPVYETDIMFDEDELKEAE